MGRASCVDENIFSILMSRELIATFTDKRVADPHTPAISGESITCGTHADVDEIAGRGHKDGGTEPRSALVCMDPKAAGDGLQVDLEETGTD